MRAINLELTDWQTTALAPVFECLRAAYKSGAPEGALAQVWEVNDGLAFMEVRVVDNDACRAIQRAVGTEEGLTAKGPGQRVMVFCPPDALDPVDPGHGH